MGDCGICLICGSILCMKITKTQNEKVHSPTSCLDHMKTCCGENGLFYHVDSGFIVNVRNKAYKLVDNLYLSELQQTRSECRERNVKLPFNDEIYDKIRKLYMNGTLGNSFEIPYASAVPF